MLRYQPLSSVSFVYTSFELIFTCWDSQGAVTYFNNGQKIIVPKTILKASEAQTIDKLERFKIFIEQNLIAGGCKDSISCSEIKEVFLTDAELDICLDEKTNDAFNKTLRAVITNEKTRSRAFQNIKVIRGNYPDRERAKQKTVFTHITWRPGPLAIIINHIRNQYNNDKRPRISETPLDVEEEDESMDTTQG